MKRLAILVLFAVVVISGCITQSSEMIDVPQVSDTCDGCMSYLAAQTSVMKFYDSSVDYGKVVVYSGATWFQAQPRGYGATLPHTAILTSADNMGYKIHVGYYVKTNTIFRSLFLDKIDKENKIIFQDQDEALDSLKSMLRSGTPVIVNLDRYFIYDDQVAISNEYASQAKEHVSYFAVVTGSDSNNIYINDPISPNEYAKDQKIPLHHFLDAWVNTANIPPYFGSYFMLILSKETGPATDIIEQLKDDNSKAHIQIQYYSELLSRDEIDYSYLIGASGEVLRREVSEFLNERGYANVAEKFRQSSQQFALIKDPGTTNKQASDVLTQIAALEKGASELWR